MTWNDTVAVRTVIQSVPIVATATYVTTAPKPAVPNTVLPRPYVVIHPKDGIPEQEQYTGPRIVEHPEFTLHIVGDSANSVQVVLELIKAKFVVNGFVIPPTVAGRRQRSGYWQMPTPLQTDNDATPPLVFAVIELGWTSVPA